MAYARFGAMITTSAAVMFGLMDLNTHAWDYVYFSETRLWMAIYIGAAMAIVMLASMLGMYADRARNAATFTSAAIVPAPSPYLVRSQAVMDGQDSMRAMIPHHSIAILTSERARIEDPRVRELADGIIETQREEIAEMKRLLADIEG